MESVVGVGDTSSVLCQVEGVLHGEGGVGEGLACGKDLVEVLKVGLGAVLDEAAGVGRVHLLVGLREKCLHQIMSSKYHDEGDLFWTFFGYLDKCFVESKFSTKGGIAHSLAECYDWSTVLIQGNEEVGALEECVEGSFETAGDFESENAILRADRVWAESNNIQLHPSVTINNITYTNSTGQDLALAICAAYREAPDECELSWEIKTFYKDEGKFEGLLTPHEEDRLY